MKEWLKRNWVFILLGVVAVYVIFAFSDGQADSYLQIWLVNLAHQLSALILALICITLVSRLLFVKSLLNDPIFMGAVFLGLCILFT